MPKNITHVRWGAQNLPYGVSFDETNGMFSGTPEEAGSYTIPVSVETNYGSDVKNVKISVKSPYWEKHNFNVGETYSGIKMFLNSTSSALNKELCVQLKVNSTKSSIIMLKPNLVTQSEITYAGGYVVSNFSYITHVCEANNNLLFLARRIGRVVLANSLIYYDNGVGMTTTGSSDYKSVRNITAFNSNYSKYDVCYSPTLDVVAAAISNSNYTNSLCVLIKDGVVVADTKQGINIGSVVNDGCLAWSEKAKIFCAITRGGVRVSSDGYLPGGQENWTMANRSFSALSELSYRADLEKFIARHNTEKIFYVSYDGSEWEKFNNTPIPLSTVNRVHYSPETGVYCAVGKGKNVYFSRDLETWQASLIEDNDNFEAGDIIYYPKAESWVLLPTSGSNYYTLHKSSVKV